MVSEFLVKIFKRTPHLFIDRVESIPSFLRLPIWLAMVVFETGIAFVITFWWAFIFSLVLSALFVYVAFFSEYPVSTAIVTFVGLSGAKITLKDLISSTAGRTS